MNITRDELIDLLDELCVAIGEVLASHGPLRESILDHAQTDAQMRKIERIEQQVLAQRAKLKKMRAALRRKQELARRNKKSRSHAGSST